MTQTQHSALAGAENLCEEILRLAKETSFERMPPLTGAEDDEQLERREIESAFRRALCRRVWCKLTPDQRRAMRSAVFTRDPTYASSCGTALDWECLREIERAVEADEEETAVTHA